MFRDKSLLTAGILAAFLFIVFVNSGNADFKIEKMEPSYGGYEDHTGCLYHAARVETDEPYFMVDWYINDVWKSTTWGADDETVAYFFPNTSDYPGTHNGTDYVIKAIAWPWEGEKDTDNYTVTVYSRFRIVRLTDAYGTSGVAYDYGSGASFLARIETSEPYSSIDWSVDGVRQHTTLGDGVKTDAYPLFNLTGIDIKGKTYIITATAKILTENGEYPNTDSYKVIVYKPRSTTKVHGNDGVKQHPNVSGYVELTRHYFDGTSIIMDGYVWASNPTNKGILCQSWFRQTQYDGNGDQANPVGKPLRQKVPSKTIKTGDPKHDSTYYASSDSTTDYFVGGPIGLGKKYYFNAHIHLETGQDTRHVDSDPFITTFTEEDNPQP